MKINTVTFDGAFVYGHDMPQSMPEIAVLGRSNVGKSSLLNFIFSRKKMVRVSQKPGKTTEINYFLVNESFYLVDVPGLGYAKVSRGIKNLIAKTIAIYLDKSKFLQGVFYLVDSRILDSNVDKEAIENLLDRNIPLQIILTKSDKMNRSQQQKARVFIQKKYNLLLPPLIVSVLKKEGKENILEQINFLLNDVS